MWNVKKYTSESLYLFAGNWNQGLKANSGNQT